MNYWIEKTDQTDENGEVLCNLYIKEKAETLEGDTVEIKVLKRSTTIAKLKEEVKNEKKGIKAQTKQMKETIEINKMKLANLEEIKTAIKDYEEL